MLHSFQWFVKSNPEILRNSIMQALVRILLLLLLLLLGQIRKAASKIELIS